MASYGLHAGRKSINFRLLIFSTFFINCLCVGLYATSYATENWFSSGLNYTIINSQGHGDSHFGLFAGVAHKYSLSTRTDTYHIVCSSGQCMFSAGKTKAEREDSISHIINGGSNATTAASYRTNSKQSGNVSDSVPGLMNEGLWIATIISLSAGLLFAVVGAVFAVINTATTPIETVTGIHGLYVWNVSAAFFALLSLILWAVQYHLYMMNNVLIEDQQDGWTTEGFEHLGYSYWLVLVAMFLHTLNCILIYIATYEKKARTQYEAPETKPGNSMLY